MLTNTVVFEWDACHRVHGHKGKCQFYHGHRYKAEVTLSAERLNDLGMIIDFGDVKEIIGRWIDSYWDHGMVLYREDPLNIARMYSSSKVSCGPAANFMKEILNQNDKGKFYIMDNPTVENIVNELYLVCCSMLAMTSVKVEKIRIYETPKCWAEITRSKS